MAIGMCSWQLCGCGERLEKVVQVFLTPKKGERLDEVDMPSLLSTSMTMYLRQQVRYDYELWPSF